MAAEDTIANLKIHWFGFGMAEKLRHHTPVCDCSSGLKITNQFVAPAIKEAVRKSFKG
tara:strand:- start:229 stop:402 length:174 start_codon:yes stop_codon:yes gene_type:complete